MLDRFPTGRDSKKMSEKEREEWFGVFEEERKKGNIFFEVGFSTAAYIDEKGIVPAIRNAMEKCLKKMEREVVIESGKTHLLLDGALRAPVRFVSQQTIIKGDEKEKLIACASIVAKVSRDRLMKKISRKHPEYLFEIHKGYGTANHRKLIKKYGLSEIHRKSFCRLS